MKGVAVFTTVESLQIRLNSSNNAVDTAFVPTMGALHEGHLELVRKAVSMAPQVVVSIFVNPTQFNSEQDLINYPRTLEKDVELLQSVGEIIVFAPNVEEMYPPSYSDVAVDLGELANVMEGKFRPGHFNGVVNVVKRLFDIVRPTFALFGEKDFQQLAIIKKMTLELKLPVQIIPCETVREDSGLAKSSRNTRLSNVQKEDALIIIETMNYIRENALLYSPQEMKSKAVSFFETGNLKLEYLEIINAVSLQEAVEWKGEMRVCIAAFCGEVRLIDNMDLTQ